jgi:hypothetical protein
MLAVALGLKLPSRVRRRLMALHIARGLRSPLTPTASVSRALPAIDERPVVLEWPEALAWGIGVGALTAFLFALRFGAAAGLLTVLILRVGVSTRRLIAIAGLGMIAIPVLYVANPAHNYGGFSFYFSLHQIAGHWVGAGVVCALLAAALLQARRVRAWRRRGFRR